MIPDMFAAVLFVGMTTLVWSSAGMVRWVRQQLQRRRPAPGRVRNRFTKRQVAILMAAHNEAAVISDAIASAVRILPAANIYVVSDGSSDDTVKLVRQAGAHAYALRRNRGKAGALAAAITHFNLCDRYKVVLVLDADTQLTKEYLRTGIRLFNDPHIVAVAGCAHSAEDRHVSPLGRLLLAYRERLYVTSQFLLKYGQASLWANAVTIVPGFASMYRTSALRHIDVVGEGLVIEDYNMTFTVHAQKLGRIAFQPQAAIAHTQDPSTLHDYMHQISRWTLGFWQTVWRHKLPFGVFVVALWVYIVEVVVSCVVFAFLLPLMLLGLLTQPVVAVFDPVASQVAWLSDAHQLVPVVITILVTDYLLAVFTAIALRRPKYLLLGLVFWPLRVLDSAISLRTLIQSLHSSRQARSTGMWVSPVRRAAKA